MNKLIILFFFIFLPYNKWVHSQELRQNHYGIKLTVNAQFGTHVNGIGIGISQYFQTAFVQLNQNYQFQFHFNHLGQRNGLIQHRLAPGVVFLTNTNQSDRIDPFWSETRHQTLAKYSIGYSYLWYFDNRQTGQRSGVFGIGLNKFFIQFENDLFAGQGKDRFRTAHLDFSYRVHESAILGGFQLWTGETRGAPWQEIASKEHPYGFRLLEDLPYGKTSHGIVYLGASHSLPYGNFMKGLVGFDSELARHILQNKISHDLPFLPRKVVRKTPHYPMLDPEGCPTFDKSLRRSPRFFGSIGMNGNWSY